ncbi:MAG TPA: SRPBCC domain-containing protein [Mucilaginibacter sp.]|nr:SRPBCC domain-containing protein [Mucilaginibacter sp.]
MDQAAYIKRFTGNIHDREIIITRVVNAPRELVYKAFTQPEHVAHWWGPAGFTIEIQKMDVRVGGSWSYIMSGRGMVFPNFILYLEVVKPERLVYLHGSNEGEEPEFMATITFEEQGPKTKITMHSVFGDAATRDFVVTEFHAIEAGNQGLDKLELYIKSQQIK